MSTLTTPLTKADFDRLELLLDRVNPNSMTLSVLDGFLCALVCGPSTEPLSYYISDILRMAPGAPIHYSLVDPEELHTLLERHWNMIAATMLADKSYLPLFVKDAEGNVDGSLWAEGFMLGMRYHSAEWSRVQNDRELWGMLVPVTLILAEANPKLIPGRERQTLTPEDRMELLAATAESLSEIFRHFHGGAKKSGSKRK